MRNFASILLLISMMMCSFAAPPPEAPSHPSADIGAPPERKTSNQVVIDSFTGNRVFLIQNILPGEWILQPLTIDNLQTTPPFLRQSETNEELSSSITKGVNIPIYLQAFRSSGSSADTRQVNGLYIFLYSTPLDPTDFLGEVISPPVVISTDMDKMVQTMARRAKAKYPDAEAIIFSNDDLSRCDAVRFK